MIGRGGMGIVRLGTQPALKRQVAIKEVRPDVASPLTISRLLREAWFSGNLEHPNILPIHALVPGEGSPRLVMKRIEGTSWSARLAADGPLPPHQLRHDLEAHLQVLIRVCHAVHFAHSKGVLHLDLKPDNVMLGEFSEVYLLDWGIAATFHDDHPRWMHHASQIRTVCGTPGYLAPEMAAARGDLIAPTADVYLLGAILHEILTGAEPHQGATLMDRLMAAYDSPPKSYPDHVPTELATICARAMARSPALRYQTAEAFRVAIEQFLHHRSSTRLCDQALLRFARLSLALSGDSARSLSAIDETRIVAECRFGLQQSLEIWPENPDAIAALQRLLTLDAQRGIDTRDPRRAAAALRELPTPAPDLAASLADLESDLESEAAKVRALEALGHEVDLSVNRRSRVFFALGLAAVWLGWNLAAYAFSRAGILPVTHTGLVIASGATLCIYVATLAYFRTTLLRTTINRRVLSLLGGGFISILLLTPAARAMHISAMNVVALHPFFYFFFLVAIAFSVDLRALWATIPILLSMVPTALHPETALISNGLSGFVAALIMAAVWWQDDRRDRAPVAPPGDSS
ncbi:MAG: serine/threonine-protein kinase [Myxococcota bacterium]